MNVIVLLCYNDDKVSVNYIKGIINYDVIDVILVIDNGSSKDKVHNLENELNKINSKKILFIKNENNLGYAKGNNTGIDYALKNLHPNNIIVSNTDVEYSEETMKYAIDYLNKHDNCDMVSPKMVLPNGNDGLIAWKLPKYWMTLWNACFLLKKFYNPQKYIEFPNDVCKVDVLPGSLLIAKADAWKTVGGFDEDTFLYGEESLLAYKLRENGKNTFVLTNVSYVHNHSTIINENVKSINSKMKLLLDANLIYNKKCLNTGVIRNFLYYFVFYLNLILMSLVYSIKKIRRHKN